MTLSNKTCSRLPPGRRQYFHDGEECGKIATGSSRHQLPGTGFMGYGLACSGIEALNRHFAGELGAFGIRSICLRPDAMPEAAAQGSHSNEVANLPCGSLVD